VSEQRGREVYRELQSLARTGYGGNTGALLVLYAVEGFLRRLAASPYAANMTLKGGMLMAAASARRMTKDADLATVGVANDEMKIARVVREIIAVDLDDGLAFDETTIRTESMREGAEYHGVRLKLEVSLSTARITTTLDFSFGDPHRSVVIDLPELLGTGTIRLSSYPPELDACREDRDDDEPPRAQYTRSRLRRRVDPEQVAGHPGARPASRDRRRCLASTSRGRLPGRSVGRHARPPGLLLGDAQTLGLPAHAAGAVGRSAR
jgi:hypothetical protein